MVAVSLGGVKTVMVDASSCARLAVHPSDGWARFANGIFYLDVEGHRILPAGGH